MNFSRLGMAVALSLLFTASLDAQVTRIGYIHVQEVMAQYPPAQAAFDQLEGAGDRWTGELQRLRDALGQAAAEYEQQQMSMTPEARAARERELAAQQTAIFNREQQIRDEAEQLQGDLLQPIMDEITAVIEEIRVEAGYALILDAGSNAILAADESLNLTQEVITRLEEKGATGGGR